MMDAYLGLVRAQIEHLMAPTRQMQRLAVDYAERLAALQTEALRSYTRIAVEQMRAVAAVGSPAELTDALDRQRVALQRLGERFERDSRGSAAAGQRPDEQTARVVGNVIFLDRPR